MRTGQRALLVLTIAAVVTTPAGCGSATSQAGRPSYATDPTLNVNAQRAADAMGLAIQQDPTYGGLRIVPRGLEVDVVGQPSATFSAAIAVARRSVPVQTRSVQHSWRSLQAVTDRLNADQSAWRRKGVTLSMWGPDVGTNRVKVWLRKYSAAAGAAITATYGADWVVVSTQSEDGGAS